MLKTGYAAYKGLQRFRKTQEQFRRIVFYSEGRHNWPHLAPLIEELTQQQGCPLSFVTSELNDPGLTIDNPLVNGCFIGEGAFRTAWFRSARASLVVMTMPDLDTSYIRRSDYGGRYVYLHHSMVSSHMIYNENAFDHFDAILCVGQHHMDEIRERERRAKLPEKLLFEHGYGRLDTMMADVDRTRTESEHTEPHVLLAPSWGDNCILERCGREVIDILLAAGIRTTVRPHPMTLRKAPAVIKDISNRFEGKAVEKTIRDKIGTVVSPNELADLPQAVWDANKNMDFFRENIRQVRERTVFNVGRSAKIGTRVLLGLLNG